VVVLADPAGRTQVVPWLTRFAGENLHVIASAPSPTPEWDLDTLGIPFHSASTVGGVTNQLKLIGPVHVLVDVTDADPAEHRTMWRRCFFQIATGGVHVLDRRSQAAATFPNAISGWYDELIDRANPEDPPLLRKVNKEIVASTAGMVVTRDLVIVSKRNRHFLKVKHHEAHKVLGAREPKLGIRVLETRPTGDLRSTARVNLHESETDIPHIIEQLSYPSLHLRHYTGRISFLGSGLFYTGLSILPDSFRHHLVKEPTNPKIRSMSPAFARISWHSRATTKLAGHYYNLDSGYSGHFGHLTTEVISRLWGWDTAKREIPDLKALMHIDYENQRDPALERRIFGAYGIDPDDVVCVFEPVILSSVVSATPMWHNAEPHYVHPGMLDVWTRLTDGLIARDVPTYDRIFVSRGRQLKRRACRNAADVEDFFTARGFTVIYPEELDLGEQVALFAGATTIAGFGGSAMFNIMHARRMTTLILLSHESYTARNEHLFTALLGGSVHYFWSAADIAQPEAGWRQDAFYSDWEFDFDRNAKTLDEVIAAL